MTKRYDKEFKRETVKRIEKEGKTVAQVSREMGIPTKTRYRWVSEFKNRGKEAFPGSGRLKPEDQFLHDLKKRNRDREKEIEILKKAMPYGIIPIR